MTVHSEPLNPPATHGSGSATGRAIAWIGWPPVVVTLDGRVLTGGWDQTARLWDAASGALLRTFEGHTGEVKSVAFSSDGARVLSGSSDKTVKLWDVATGGLLRSFEGHSAAVNAVAFARDGMRVLSASDDKTVRLWDAASGRQLREFSPHADKVNAIAVSPDGASVLSASNDKTVKLWKVATGRIERTFEGKAAITAVAFAPDGAGILSGTTTRACFEWAPNYTRCLRSGTRALTQLWDAATGQELRSLTGNIKAVAYSPDSKRLAYCIASVQADAQQVPRSVNVLDAETGQLLLQLPGGGWEVFEIPRPAVVTVKEGINLPRYPSVPGRLRARKKEIEQIALDPATAAPTRIRLRVPVEQESAVEILGEGPEAAPRVVEVLRRLGLIA
jgi:WD40 repeat protein